METLLSAGRVANVLKTSNVEEGSKEAPPESTLKSPLARQTGGLLWSRLST